jgi:putative addiction module CopG family antidote
MAIERMNISRSPQMARFIRDKVKNGQYSNISEVVRDAVRHMQEAEAATVRASWVDFESGLTPSHREGIRRSVQEGIRDIEQGHYEDYDAEGLRALAKELVVASVEGSARRRRGK